AAGLLLLASVYGLVGGIAWQTARLDETAVSAEEGATLIAGQRAAAAGAAARSGRVGNVQTFAALPPAPLAAFSVGLEDLYPKRAEISVWERADTLFGRYQLESPLSLLVGRFDLGFVVLYLLPLFVLALSYDLLAGERERGTLALVLMQPVSLSRLVLAKLLARLIWLTAFLAITVVAGGLVARVPIDIWPRLVGWFAIAWLYGLFWLALAAWVATLTRRAETCAAALAVLWLAIVLVIPGLLNVAAQAASPTPSRLEFVTAMRAATSEASRESAEILASYYHEHPELAANGQQGGFLPAFYAAEREIERRLAPLMQDYDRRLAGQQRLVATLRFASPAVLANEAMIELAGSGLDRQRSAVAQARGFLAAWHAFLAPKVFLGQSLTAADYDNLPIFDFREPPVSAVHIASAAGGLVGIALLALVLARRRLRRFSVH
ncbi:MAG: DUF3526 domain-containing protein, partial [Acidobacteriota bacterium]